MPETPTLSRPDGQALRAAARRYLDEHPAVARDAGLSLGELLRRKLAERDSDPARVSAFGEILRRKLAEREALAQGGQS